MRLNEMNFFEVVLIFISLCNIVSCRHQNYTVKRQVDIGIINPSTFPHLVLIGYETKYGLIWACSGTLIDQQKIITSSECINSQLLGNPKVVRLLNEQLEVFNFTSSNEIAILFLKKLQPTSNLVCLSDDVPSTAITAGWGGLSPDNELHATINKDLSTAEVEVFEESKYRVKVRSVQASQCVTDKGGPIQIRSANVGCRFSVFGILREWKDCGENNSFGEYIRLGRHIPWIKSL